MGVKPVQTKTLLRVANGYLGLDLFRVSNPYTLFAACMPWGTPIGLRVTKQDAENLCKITDESQDMAEWREQNKRIGFDGMSDVCFVKELPLPTIMELFGIHGELVKDPQIDILLLLEDGSWVGEGLVEWHKKNRPEWYEKESSDDSNS